MHQLFGDIEGVSISIDDILVDAPSKKVHDEILEKVLKRARQVNLRKIQFREI